MNLISRLAPKASAPLPCPCALSWVLVLAPSVAFGQTSLGVNRSASASDVDVVTDVQSGGWASADVSGWLPRLPLDPTVELTRVTVNASVELSATVTVFNPTSMAQSGWVGFRFGYYSIGGQGTWGGFDAENYTDTLAVTDLQPGETRILGPWTWMDQSGQAHTEMGAAPWWDVEEDMLGDGPSAYTISGGVTQDGMLGNFDIVSVDLGAEVSGTLALLGTLYPATDAASYCPSDINSSGQRAELRAFGAALPGSTGFKIRAIGLPPLAPLALLAGTSAASVPTAGGTVCIGGQRLVATPVMQSLQSGTLIFDVPFESSSPGSTIYAQLFFREPGGFALSDALEITL